MVEAKIKALRDELERHNYNYYVLSAPTISDFEFDKMMKELQELEAAHPEFADPDSPTRRVGSDLSKEFEQVVHKYPMLSLGNTYSEDEIRDFYDRTVRSLNEPFEIVAELKYDGTSISLTYEKGRLTRAVTRGDGTRGDEDEVVRGVEEVFEAVKSLIIGDNDKEKVINQKAKPLAERWITLSACKSDQVNIEMKNPAVGKLTYALWMELKNGDKINNEEFIKRIRKFVNRNTSSRPQQPVLTGNDKDKYNITDILRK